MYTIKNESEHHYEIQTPEGSSFHVAKVGLSPKMHKKLKELCSGGEAHYDAGTGPEGAQAADALVSPTAGGGVGDTAAGTASDFGNQPTYPTSDTPPPPVNLNTEKYPEIPSPLDPRSEAEKTADIEKAAADTEKAAPIHAPVPTPESKTGPITIADAQKEQRVAEDVQQQGLKAQAAAGADAAPGLIGAGKKHVESLSTIISKENTRTTARQELMDTTSKALATGKIPPETYSQYFGKLGFWGKLGTAAALALGTIGNKNGVNPAVTAIDGMIKDDVEAQKTDTSNKQNLYQKLIEQGKSDREATLEATAQEHSMFQAKLGVLAAKNLKPEYQAQYLSALGQSLGDSAKIHNQQALLNVAKTLSTQPVIPNAAVPYTANPKLAVNNGDGTSSMAVNQEGYDKITAANAQYKPAIKAVTDLLNIKVNPLNKFDPNYQRAETLVAAIPTMLGKAFTGSSRVSPELLKTYQKTFANPTSFLQKIVNRDPRTLEILNLLKSSYEQAVAPHIQGYKTQSPVTSNAKR